MKILIVNTHSTLNAGDAGIVLAQIHMLRTYFPNAEIDLTSRTARIDKWYYHPRGITVHPPLIPAPSIFNSLPAKIWETLKNLLDIPSKYRLYRAMKECHLVVSSGGGYFFSNRRWLPGPMYFQNLLPLKLAAILKKPIILFPQSIGPFHNKPAHRLINHILKDDAIKKILTREERSKALLEESGRRISEKAALCPDMIFYLRRRSTGVDPAIKIQMPRPVVGITVRYWDFPEIRRKSGKRKKRESFIHSLRDICEYIFQKHGGSILIYPQVRGPGKFENDRHTSRILFSELNDIPDSNKMYLDLPDNATPEDILDINSQTDLIIATRLHSALLALMTATPVITISYQPKSWGIMKMLDLENCCFDISDLNPKAVIGSIEKLLEGGREIRGRIDRAVEEMRTCLTSVMEEVLPKPPPEQS